MRSTTNGAPSPRRCCRAFRPASSASTSRGSSPSATPPPNGCSAPANPARAWSARAIEDVLPALGPILQEARSTRLRLHQGQAKLQRDGRERLLNVRVTSNPQRADQGSVITLDDITDLVSAQRTAAWADVARRIAHEIKNPLTPIQLSAERLKRRYGRLIVEGRDVFDQCTDTIIRQVDDIKRMVDEFSSFARMPKARPMRDDLVDCVRQVLFLMRVGRPDIAIEDKLPAEPLLRQIRPAADFAGRSPMSSRTPREGIDALEGGGKGKGRILVEMDVGADRSCSHLRQRQRQGLSQRRSRQAHRTLCDDARRRHRTRPADRHQNLRRSRRRRRFARRIASG